MNVLPFYGDIRHSYCIVDDSLTVFRVVVNREGNGGTKNRKLNLKSQQRDHARTKGQ